MHLKQSNKLFIINTGITTVLKNVINYSIFIFASCCAFVVQGANRKAIKRLSFLSWIIISSMMFFLFFYTFAALAQCPPLCN